MSNEKPPKNSLSGDWEMPEPTFRVSEGRVIHKEADPSDVITEEREISSEELPTEEPVSPPPEPASTAETDARGYGQEDDGRPVFGSGTAKRGCLAVKVLMIAVVAGAVLLLTFAVFGIYYFFYSRPESTF
jgi:hypothetical protein